MKYYISYITTNLGFHSFIVLSRKISNRYEVLTSFGFSHKARLKPFGILDKSNGIISNHNAYLESESFGSIKKEVTFKVDEKNINKSIDFLIKSIDNSRNSFAFHKLYNHQVVICDQESMEHKKTLLQKHAKNSNIRRFLVVLTENKVKNIIQIEDTGNTSTINDESLKNEIEKEIDNIARIDDDDIYRDEISREKIYQALLQNDYLSNPDKLNDQNEKIALKIRWLEYFLTLQRQAPTYQLLGYNCTSFATTYLKSADIDHDKIQHTRIPINNTIHLRNAFFKKDDNKNIIYWSSAPNIIEAKPAAYSHNHNLYGSSTYFKNSYNILFFGKKEDNADAVSGAISILKDYANSSLYNRFFHPLRSSRQQKAIREFIVNVENNKYKYLTVKSIIIALKQISELRFIKVNGSLFNRLKFLDYFANDEENYKTHQKAFHSSRDNNHKNIDTAANMISF